ncbi:MAG: NAD(P)/FAD-dependent oxidoreductase [Candidatus Fimenecus sp.]
MRYAIIGASAAGISCAKTLRENDKSAVIDVFTEENYMPYSRPIISYYLKSYVEKDKIYLETPSFYEANKISVHTSCPVTDINSEKKTLTAGGNSYNYDKLLIATGSKPFVPPVENSENKENVFTFLDMEMSEKLKEYADENSNAVVIGAGLIGLKAAEGLQKICKSVTVVELADKVLPSILDADGAKLVRENLEKNNITVKLGNTVSRCIGEEKVTSVVLKSGEEIPCSLLVIAVGVRPRTELAEKAGAAINRGICVNKDTMETTVKDIYAAGDCVNSTDILDGKEKIIALWPNAVREGKTAALNMCGKNEKDTGSFAVNAIDFFGQRICTCGLINDENAEVLVSAENGYKRLLVRDGRLIGFVLIDDNERSGMYTYLIKTKTPLDTLNGDILKTPSFMMFDKATRTERLTGGVTV